MYERDKLFKSVDVRGTHYKPPRGVDESKTPAGRGGWGSICPT